MYSLNYLKLKNIKKYYISYLFLLPALLFIGFFFIYPAIRSLSLSFFEWNGYSEQFFVGFQNWIKVFKDEIFHTALKNTLIYMGIVTSGVIVIGITLAAQIHNKIRGWQFYKFAFFLVTVLSTIVVSLLWSNIYNPNPKQGLINNFLNLIHLDNLENLWLGNSDIALYCITATVIWQWAGLYMIFILSAMQNIDENIYDAAKIDGVNNFGKLFRITLPIIKDQLIIILLVALIATAKSFDIVWVMTGGGPGHSTQILGTYLYTVAFRYNEFGSASVIAVVIFIWGIILSLIYLNYGKFHRVGK